MQKILLQRAALEDLDVILNIFDQTVRFLNAADYSPAQINAWTSSVAKRDRWQKKIAEQWFLLARVGNQPVGFASLSLSGYLDFLYVRKDHQRQGVAKALYQALETKAGEQENHFIETDASITARPFFEKQGFVLIQEQEVLIDGVSLRNFKMRKPLA